MAKDSSEPYELTALWDAPDGSLWQLTFRLQSIGGRQECVGMGLVSCQDRPLTTPVLRALPFARELDRAWQGARSRDERLKDLMRRVGVLVPEPEQARPETARGKPRQRARYTIKDYQRVATVYRELWTSGETKSPTRDTAEALGLRYNQAAKLIQRCRTSEVGLLPPTDQGLGGCARGSTEEDE